MRPVVTASETPEARERRIIDRAVFASPIDAMLA